MKMSRLISFALACLLLIASLAVFACAEDLTFSPKTKNGKIYGIPASTKESSVAHAYHNANVEIFDKNGKAIASGDKVGTGYTVKINGYSYAAVVLGDVDGDGEIKTYDCVAVKRAYLGTAKLGVLETEAAGVKEGGKLSAINYIMVRRAYFGTYNINRDYTCDPYCPSDDDSGFTPGWV